MDLTSQTSEHLAWDTEDNALRGAIAARLHRTLRHKRFIPATATRWFVASEHEAKLSRREITVPPHQAVRRLAGPPRRGRSPAMHRPRESHCRDNAMNLSRRRQAADEARCARQYQVELAQGASHLASMLHAASMRAAVEETAQHFQQRYGREDLRVFLTLLARQVERRGQAEALTVLHDFIGRLDSNQFETPFVGSSRTDAADSAAPDGSSQGATGNVRRRRRP